MEDVVLHYQSGSADGLRSLLETTEKLLQPFPCRTPPAFTPWFPAADRRLPIRPARPAPVIISADDSGVSDSRPHAHPTGNQPRKPKVVKARHDHRVSETPRSPPERPPGREVLCVSETTNRVPPASLCHIPERGVTRPSPQKDKGGFTVSDSPLRRSWSIFRQRGVLLQSSQSLSRHLHHVVSVHGLHLRQRVKWVISEHNCGAGRDVEQVWRTLSRSVRSTGLPTCNANIQRDLAEIWVFCDVLFSEQVGRVLKDELQLSGRIVLSVPRLGNVFSM